MVNFKTQVTIIGGGPSGLLLSQLLMNEGIETIVLEKHSKSHVLSRIRAGVLESGTVDILKKAGVGERIDIDGFVHEGTYLSSENKGFRISFSETIGKSVTIFGQTEVTKDLYQKQEERGANIFFQVKNVNIIDPKSSKTEVIFEDKKGKENKIVSDFIIGCDGFHGVSRQRIPSNQRKEYERIYPFGWLGILSETPPVSDELIYANTMDGFALCSMRNNNLSRYYIQCDVNTRAVDYSDDYFWRELTKRLPENSRDNLRTGPSIEKSIAPLRSFVVEPLQYGKLFLVGDAAHIVPPTGAKGLNLAVSDVHYLSEGCSGVTPVIGVVEDCSNLIELGVAGINIYPNPNNGRFTIVNNSNTPLISVKVTDMNGKLVYSSKVNSNNPININLENLNRGLYLVSIITEKGIQNKNVIIN